MTHAIARTLRTPIDSFWPLLVFGMGPAGLLGTAPVAGGLLYILESAGAVGGTDPHRQRGTPGVR